MGELIHIRLDPKMRKAIKEVLKTHHYASESEFVRASVRKSLESYERERLLRQWQGSVPRRKTPPGPPPSDVFREFGLNVP